MALGWLEQGRIEGMRDLVEKQLEKSFGLLGPEVRKAFENLSAEQLEQVALKLLDAPSLKDLGLENA